MANCWVSVYPERRAAERVRRVRRAARRNRGAAARVRRRAASRTSSAAAAARRRITSARLRAVTSQRRSPAPAPSDSNSARPGSTELSAVLRVCPASSRSSSGPTRNFQMIGERTNVTGSKRFARLIKDDDFGDAAAVALEQVRGGANLIDVNMDEGMLDSEQAMTTFLNYIATEPEIARVPVMIDSSKWSVIEAGLKCVQGKARRQLDLAEGRRSRFSREGADRPPLRRRGRRHGLRRAGAGRHDRAKGRDLPAVPTGCSSSRPASIRRTSSSIRTCSRLRPASRSTTSTRSTSSKRRG